MLQVVTWLGVRELLFFLFFPPTYHIQLRLLFILGACLKTSLEGQRALFLWHCMEDVGAFVLLKWRFHPLHPGYFLTGSCRVFRCRPVSSTTWKEGHGSGCVTNNWTQQCNFVERNLCDCYLLWRISRTCLLARLGPPKVHDARESGIWTYSAQKTWMIFCPVWLLKSAEGNKIHFSFQIYTCVCLALVISIINRSVRVCHGLGLWSYI